MKKLIYLISIVMLMLTNPAFSSQPDHFEVSGPVTLLASGKPIPVGASDKIGPLAFPGIENHPVGIAFVFGSRQPDIFLMGNRHGPGLYLYKYLKTNSEGVPVFGNRIRVKVPFSVKIPPQGTIFQINDGTIHGVWLLKNDLVHTVYDRREHSFAETQRVAVKGLPRAPCSLGVLLNLDGSVEVLLGISDGVASRPRPDYKPDPQYLSYYRDPRYIPYDGAGVWRGGFPYACLYAVSLPKLLAGPATEPKLVSKTKREVRDSYYTLTTVNLGTGRTRDVIGGSHYGGIYYYRNNSSGGINLEQKRCIVGTDGVIIRHPAVWPSPAAYPNPITGFSDLIAGCEGGLYYYSFTGNFSENGCPVYESPRPVLEQNADLYGGTLLVPNVVDWNGDGAMDIVSGNSHGKILFFRNAGSNARPAFLPGVPLEAGGQEVHIQPGYGQDIQGPGEARWGYTCPTVVDWNKNGLLDILMSDSTAKHTVYINRGQKTKPVLDFGNPLYLDGLDFHGTWRCKPAVAELAGRMAYVTLDDDDEFHLYWQLDDYNLEDGGKLKLDDNSNICANFLKAGGTGRLKMNLVDWDMDGKLDMIVGTPRHASVPNPKTGLPWSVREEKPEEGSAVLFMKNVGSNKAPVFQFPKLMKFKGKEIFLGQHACGPTPADFGNNEGPDLIVGTETGRFIFYKHADLSTD